MRVITSKGVFDTEEELVVIQFDTNPEKHYHAKNIENMEFDAMNYAIFPKTLGLTTEDLKEFIDKQSKIK